MTKKELRLKYKSLRNQISDADLDEMSLSIANQILKLLVWDKTYFHVFIPILVQKEVNTEFVLHLLQGKDKEILVSKSDFDTLKMTHFLLTDNTKFKNNDYQIPEPVSGIQVASAMIEVVFVPLLAYDKQGNRVGYGKGFYDTFLSECKPDTIKIGLSFFEPEDAIEDVFETDVKLHYCVTPRQIYQF